MTDRSFKEHLLDRNDEKAILNKEIEETLAMFRTKVMQLEKEKKKKHTNKPAKKVSFSRRVVRFAKRKVKGLIKPIVPNKQSSEKKANTIEFSGVSVIIPTFAPNEYVSKAVESVLSQEGIDFPLEVIIAVNGGNEEYYGSLTDAYSDEDRVKVVFSKKGSPSVGRNLGIVNASFSHIVFVDDDDFLSEGYIAELVRNLDADTDFICGRVSDITETGNVTDNYINLAIDRFNKSKGKNKYHNYLGILSTVTGRLIAKDLMERGTIFNEDFKHTEDVIFWADNYRYLHKIKCCRSDSKEKYFRRVREGSTSRPTDERAMEFFLKGRLEVIKYAENKVFDSSVDMDEKTFMLKVIEAQNNIMKKFYDEASDEMKDAIRPEIREYDGYFVKKGLFSDKKAIAFCYNFAPAVDTSAYVAARRLRQINKLENIDLNWTAVSKDTTDAFKKDDLYNNFYVKFLCYENYFVGGHTSFNSKNQYNYAKIANRRVDHIDAEVIYSRTMAPGSHLAAYLYKKEHPNVKWYAEFSDPVSKTAELVSRPPSSAGEYTNEDSFLNECFEMCEILAYESADHIIFTNDNQKEYMLSYNKRKDLNEEIEKKALVMKHPAMEGPFVHLIDSKYKMDETKINIGYFGRFYKTRAVDDMLGLLENENVVLHLFVLQPQQLKHLACDRIIVNGQKPYLEFLDLASKMDYVFLNDMTSQSGVNPWLPSKVSDYLASGTKIIGKYIEGSPLSKLEERQLIKVAEISSEFASSLKKQDQEAK